MIALLAQFAAPADWIAPLAVQGAVGAIAIFMLKWFMGKNDAALKDLANSHDRMGREIAGSNDRMGRAHLMLVLALDGVNEAAKARAKNLLIETEEAIKAREQQQKDARP